MARQGKPPLGSATTSSTSSVTASIRDSILLLGSAGGLVFRGATAAATNTAEHGYSIIGKRRTLLNEELMMDDDSIYDDQAIHEKKRRLTSEQVHLLEESFEAESKLEPEKKTELAKKLGLQPRQVAVWYQNRRARWKTKQLERDFDHLKALYDSLVADHSSLVADNQRLRSEVMSLTEQLKSTANPPATADHPLMPHRDAQQDDVPPASEPSTTTPAASFEANDDFGHHLQLPDDRSIHGGCLYVAPSDEDDFSDDGCGYFPPAFPEDEHGGEQCGTSCYDDVPPTPKDDVGGMVGWWIWS